MSILDLIIVILVIAWLGGFGLNVGGGLIHLLLLIALVVLIYRLLTGRPVQYEFKKRRKLHFI